MYGKWFNAWYIWRIFFVFKSCWINFEDHEFFCSLVEANYFTRNLDLSKSICTTLLSLFFTGKFTQSAFNLICEFTNKEYLEDIYYGEIYNKILDAESDKSSEHQRFFTFILNTDRIQMCEKSRMTLWPIILALNEIPIQKRFWFDNIIIPVGLKRFLHKKISK